MLPHILQTTGRAVAVVHNQTHTFRNVLQLQSSGPSSGSGSSWGNGPGPGSSKFGAGSRFYAGYNNAGRAVTQANAVTAHDGQVSQSDDTEDFVIKRSALPAPAQKRRQRMRSSSVSMGVAGRVERGETMGVLKTVQLHARGKHAFAPESMASAKERLLADPILAPQPTIESQPLLVRRNSTSAPLSPLLDASEPPISSIPIPPPLEDSHRPSSKAARPKSPKPKSSEPITQTVTPPQSPKDVDSGIINTLATLSKQKDHNGVAHTIRLILESKTTPSLALFNAALAALVKTRIAGEPLTSIIKVYDAMLEKSVVPDVETYDQLIYALSSRDQEVHKASLSLEVRLKNSALVGREETALQASDSARMEKLRAEDNFPSAMSLFEGVLAIGGRDQLRESTFVRLLASAANHADVNAAIHIFAQMEARPDMRMSHVVYRYLILAFSNTGQIDQAEEVFRTYLKACKKGQILRYPVGAQHIARQTQVQVWNLMIEAFFRAGQPDKAIELVDRIVQSKATDVFTAADVPVTTSSTLSTVIAGFIQTGDIQSALEWFDRLLGLPNRAPEDPFQGAGGEAMRPDSLAWHMILDALASHGRVDDLVRLYKVLKTIRVEDSLFIRSLDVRIVHEALLNGLENMDQTQVVDNLRFLLEDLMLHPNDGAIPKQLLTSRICTALAERGVFNVSVPAFYENAREMMAPHVKGEFMPLHMRQERLHELATTFIQAVYEAAGKGLGQLDFLSALTLGRMAYQLGLQPQLRFAPFFLDAYGRTRFQKLIPFHELVVEDWNILFTYATHFEANKFAENPEDLAVIPEFAFNGLMSLLDDLASSGIGFDVLDVDLKQRVIRVLDHQFGQRKRIEIMENFGPSYSEASQQFDQLQYQALENSLTQSTESYMQPVENQVLAQEAAELYNGGNIQVDLYLSRSIDSLGQIGFGPHKLDCIEKAYSMFEEGLTKGLVPNIAVLSKLIQGVGRAKWMDKLRELYTAAQAVLPTLAVEAQLTEWARVEDSMIIALAHAGHVDAAHVHRYRILNQGLCPSADAYGILIQLVKDTTDDTSGALALFQEAIEHGVQPNMYLYNNVISKLAKARKADYALELFQQMKANGIRPSSITYGAIIGACARVGDVQAAEAFFKEMVAAPGFKARVPPYNTMMQLYSSTKPNRTSVLYFYEEMRKAGVKPSSHTYKLLLDTYGSIEPVELAKMEKTFDQLQKDTSVEITGAHFASLINAYGCVSKDFDKAVSVFEALLNGEYERAPKPDAVVFEAIINVVVAHKRTELIPVYVSKMTEVGVHMTAYIANFLIKGYANVGDMGQARAIFESLSNPPTGVAAPNNHAPHSPEIGSDVSVSVMEPVYREPSTWEVIVRAELGAGNRDAATDLLERLKERQYPEAVYNRISGVLTDYSVPL